jgi:hypothetical protein
MNETLRVGGRTLCNACCAEMLAQAPAPRPDLQRQVDPTICANCNSDNGTVPLRQLAGLPVCDRCEAFFRNRPFPAWVKLSLAAVLALVAISLIWNMRFFQAYLELKRFAAYSEQGQLEAATAQMSLAASHVPESRELCGMATFFQGVDLRRQNKYAEALPKLVQSRGQVPPEWDVDTLILHTRGAAAFDAKDYDEFLAAATTLNQRRPDEPYSRATLASALACKYVQTGDAAFRDRALACLREAKNMPAKDPTFPEYENRILYRIESREIITLEEFQKRFPNGWSPEKKEAGLCHPGNTHRMGNLSRHHRSRGGAHALL